MIAVAGVILASTLPGGEMGSDIEKDRITREKMQKIEAATQSFMAANLRRPCPANGTLAISNANFGKEDTTPGRCSSSNFYTQSSPLTKTGTTSTTAATVTAMSDTTGLSIGMLVTGEFIGVVNDVHILSIDSATQITLDKYPIDSGTAALTFTSMVAGVVPTRTLGLPDDYMFDGYGRRIGYAVDTRATDSGTCRNMAVTKTPGSLQIMDAAAGNNIDNVMWALISYGKDGYGAFPMQGSSIANRINSGATSDDEEINAFVNTNDSFATAFTKTLVRHEPITTAGSTYFDDIVWTQESSKNTCCTGKMCQLGTRIDGAANEYLGTNVEVGDINGDGIPDMVFSKGTVNTIRVVLGSRTGWQPNAGMSMATANSSRFFTITNDSGHPYFAWSVKVGDINGDGYDDIAISYGDNTSSAIKIFYGSANPVSTNTSTMTNVITFPNTTANRGPIIVLGNFASTTKKDILALVKTASGTGASTAYLIYGAASYALTAEAVTTVAASVGFKINTTSPSIISLLTGKGGDLNGDGYDDIILGYNTYFFILFGESPANWNADKTTAATGSTPDIVNIDTRVAAGGTEAITFTATGPVTVWGTVAVADMNGDAYKDLIISRGGYFAVYYGKAAGSWANVNFSDASTFNGINGFRFDPMSSVPAWSNNPATYAVVEDINGDGKNDIIMKDAGAGPNGILFSGASWVVLQPSAGWSSIWSSGTIDVFTKVFDTVTGLPLNNDVSKGYRIDGADSIDRAAVLGVGDINGDGINDLIIGAYGRNSNAGSVYVLFGHKLVPWDTATSLKWLN